ncbi:MAG TPA: penicillin-binding transpeptidase domain-containing protein [Acidimicrobiia bacterium]|nr:penicillin-binding transpeptidase domain-containing protein [Acidimicrobiia bacterium]
MNDNVRRVGWAVTALFLLLVGQLTYLQVFHANALEHDPRNVRTQVRDYSRPRGEILTADGEIVARSVPAHDEFKYQREYPLGELFAHISGYQSFLHGNTGVEAAYNSVLVGRDFQQQTLNPGDLLINRQATGTVVLSLTRTAQEAAKQALGTQHGSVVVIEPSTGAVVALYSNPSFDPNPLAGHDQTKVQAYYDLLNALPSNPALSHAYGEIYPPGSTFKVITTSAALETNVATVDRPFPVLRELKLPNTDKTIKNFGGEACGGTVAVSFRVSCNTTFAQLGLDLADKFVPAMKQFGIGDKPPLDIAGAARSTGLEGRPFAQNQPFYAQAGIGQAFVATSPLQMALVASAIANNGAIMRPHVVQEVRDPDGAIVRRTTPKLWTVATTPDVAAQVKGLMVSVVQQGTGTRAQVPGVQVAGKTGTAQTDSGPPHAWFIGFAPADAPKFAIAVLVEHGGAKGNEATGGQVAAPIAGRVLATLLGK